MSNQPIRWVINTGGQDHRWLGNGYFREQGAELIAHSSAVPDMRARAGDQLQALQNLLGPRFEGTHPVYPEQLLTAADTGLELGGVRVELRIEEVGTRLATSWCGCPSGTWCSPGTLSTPNGCWRCCP